MLEKLFTRELKMSESMFCFATKEILAILYRAIKRNAEIINSEMEEVQCPMYKYLF